METALQRVEWNQKQNAVHSKLDVSQLLLFGRLSSSIYLSDSTNGDGKWLQAIEPAENVSLNTHCMTDYPLM